MLVVEFLSMERNLGVVVTLLPRMYGMVAMESLPDESDFGVKVVRDVGDEAKVDGQGVSAWYGAGCVWCSNLGGGGRE